MIRERDYAALPGLPMALLLLAVLASVFYALVTGERASALRIVTLSIALLVDIFLLAGLFIVNPNEGRVLQFFGDYVGTSKKAGLRWVNPLYTKKRISRRRSGGPGLSTGPIRRSSSRSTSALSRSIQTRPRVRPDRFTRPHSPFHSALTGSGVRAM